MMDAHSQSPRLPLVDGLASVDVDNLNDLLDLVFSSVNLRTSRAGVAASNHVIHDVCAFFVSEHPVGAGNFAENLVGVRHFVEQVVGGTGGGASKHVRDAAHVRRRGHDLGQVEVDVDAILMSCCHWREDVIIEGSRVWMALAQFQRHAGRWKPWWRS
jgi:hypothetical protein